MCDTLVVTAAAGARGDTLLAKNSDRHPNEAHQVLCVAPARHPANARLRCTWIEIPQVRETRGVLLAKPWWIWGAEMGANDAGVAIGNEALFTRVPPGPDALLGMDLLRLGLERAGSATEAVQVMTDLLERHGQGGACEVGGELRYDNGYLIADRDEAWVLETAGAHWVARRVQRHQAISNVPSIRAGFDAASAGIEAWARDRGWLEPGEAFDFQAAVTDRATTEERNGPARCRRGQALLDELDGRAGIVDMLRCLRDHGSDPDWRPDAVDRRSTLCMHAAGRPGRSAQTTGSLVSVLGGQTPLHLVTGVAAPCLAPFLPTWVDVVPQGLTNPLPAGRADQQSLFWRHERLHRALLETLPGQLERIRAQRDTFEAAMIEEALALDGASRASRQAFADDAFAAAEALRADWARAAGTAREGDGAYRRYWTELSAACGLNDLPQG